MKHFSLLFIVALFTVNTAQADDRLLPALGVQIGADAQEFKLGLGYWSDRDTKHNQFYISHFKSEDTNRLNGKSVGEHQYTSSRIGLTISGFGFAPNQASEGGFFLYSNKSDFNIDRAGVGVNLALGKMLSASTRIQAGVVLMPEFLSTDWDAKAVLEYELHAGLTYRINSVIDISANYRHGATFDDTDVKHYGQLMGGIAIRL